MFKPCEHISLHPVKSSGVKARHVCGKMMHPKPSAPPYHMMNTVQNDKMKSSSKKNGHQKKVKSIEYWFVNQKKSLKSQQTLWIRIYSL